LGDGKPADIMAGLQKGGAGRWGTEIVARGRTPDGTKNFMIDVKYYMKYFGDIVDGDSS
jgi:hypothetical protein